MVRKSLGYFALNIFFTNGKTLWALREINLKNKFVKEKKLINYYSLYQGEADKSIIISSEVLKNLSGVNWRLMKNHELIEIDIKNLVAKTYII